MHSSLRSRHLLGSLAVALWAAPACEVEERVAVDAPRSAPSAAVVTFHPTAPGPRHRQVLPDWDIGVGFVRIPPAPDGPPGAAAADTIPILAEPHAAAPLVARAFHREWQLEIEAARPGLVSGALETGYEETALPVLETGAGGQWLQVSYAFDSAGTAVTGWVDGTHSAVETVTWTSWLANGAFFFLEADSIAFYEEPEGPVLTLALVPGLGTQRFDYTLYDIRTRGAWMQVRVASPSDYCVDDATSGGSGVATNAWIRFLDEEGRPRIWYHTRGC
jgi:hypothetical protein